MVYNFGTVREEPRDVAPDGSICFIARGLAVGSALLETTATLATPVAITRNLVSSELGTIW
jgi:hypothetical protein